MNLYNSLQFGDNAGCKKEMIKAISTNLKNIRFKKNLTQEQVAEIAGINAKYLGEIERGEKNPTALIISRLSEALQVPICEILSMNNCPHINDYLLTKVRALSAGREDSERQKAMRLLEVFFE
jgi:transcriptional regulator with XRE-family HTH domain